MRYLPALSLAFWPLATLAQGPAPGAWTCLTPDGAPAFAFSLLAGGTYADPEGREGAPAFPEPGLFLFETGTWAGSSGSWVPEGWMALMLPGAVAPVLCRQGG